METPTAPLLTTAELGRHIGNKCELEYCNGTVWVSAVETLNVLFLWNDDETVRNIRPILKPLSVLRSNPEHCVEMMKAAFAQPFIDVIVEVETDSVIVFSVIYSLRIYSDGRLEAKEYSTPEFAAPLPFNAVAVVDFLRSSGYDIENLIATGKAVPEP